MDEDHSWSEFISASEELVEFIKPELDPGERLLWAATSRVRDLENRPTGKRVFIAGLVCLSLSATFFFAVFGPLRSLVPSREQAFTMAGLGFAFVGVVTLSVASVTWSSYCTARDFIPKATYALTNRRAILWVAINGSQAVDVCSYALGSVKEVHRVQFPDGSGNVLFSLKVPKDFDLEDEEFEPFFPGFYGIENVRKVEELARKILLRPVSTRYSLARQLEE